MLTPYFWLAQDHEFLLINIKCPLIRAQDVDYTIDLFEFGFYSHPYLLKLSFENRLAVDGREKVVLELGKGVLSFSIPKHVPEEHFQDLDLLSKFMVIDEMPTHPPVSNVEEVDGQCTLVELDADHLPNPDWSTKYGFNNSYSGYFSNVPSGYLAEIMDLQDPEQTSVSQRIALKSEREQLDFNQDHYMFDFVDAETNVRRILEFKSFLHPHPDTIQFTQQETEQMISLKRRSWIIENPTWVYLGLVDLLLAYCYNKRVTEGENTVESIWTIRKLSSMLSWLVSFDTIDQVVISFVARSLIYPLYRNWDLALAIVRDTAQLFQMGKRAIVKCLLETKALFDHDETRHVHSKIFLEDYCLWVPRASDSCLGELGHLLANSRCEKSFLSFHLEEYEALSREQFF